MIQDNQMIKVTNRSNSMVGYQIPEMHVKRYFASNETKTLSALEIRALSMRRGGKALIQNNLIIDSSELVQELLYEVQPEYYYTDAEVEMLLLNGSEDQLLDALDFAPEGVIELIKDKAVKIKLNDVRKRQIIAEKTGFNITKAIEINEESNTAPAVSQSRRSAPINAKEAASEAPARRVAAPKYTVATKNN